MTRLRRVLLVTSTACLAAAGGAALARVRAQGNGQKATGRARVAISQALQPMDGAHLEIKLVEVNYAPGESSEAHSHPCPVVAYVAEGAIRSQVDAGPETLYKAGETFYEPANGVHRVSANGSQTAAAKLLAVFLCDHSTPLTVAPPKKN